MSEYKKYKTEDGKFEIYNAFSQKVAETPREEMADELLEIFKKQDKVINKFINKEKER